MEDESEYQLAGEFVKYQVRDEIALVTLDRPPVNAVSQQMYAELIQLFAGFDERLGEAKVVIIRGEGRHFSAGNDLNEFLTLTPVNAPLRLKLARDAFAAIYDCPVPVIAAVHGFAVGSGLAIAAACDMVVCAEQAQFGVPEVSVGVMGGAKHLARLVPQPIMRKMYFTAEPVPGPELAKYGGVVEVCTEGELLGCATALARQISAHSTIALRTAKESLNMVEFMDLKSGYEAEQRMTLRLSSSSASMEARRSRIEKRTSRFENDFMRDQGDGTRSHSVD